MKRLVLMFLIFCCVFSLYALEKKCPQIIGKEIIVEDIGTSCIVLDEWKNPGLYSPANMFDGDMNTCFAEGDSEQENPLYGKNGIAFEMKFKYPVYIDEIRIMNGFGKNETYFKNNNRVKELFVSIPSRDDHETSIILEDKMEFQSFKFDKSYLIHIFYIKTDKNYVRIYKGEKYDDTCITEIEFYNQGRKIPVKNIKDAKKNYLLGLKYFLEDIASGKQSEYKKYKWKVEDYKLYKYKNGNWLLTKYFISGDESIEAFDEKGNCNNVTHNSDFLKCSRFEVKDKK